MIARRAKASADRSNYSGSDRTKSNGKLSRYARYTRRRLRYTPGTSTCNKRSAARPYTPLVSVTSIRAAHAAAAALLYRCYGGDGGGGGGGEGEVARSREIAFAR